MMANQTKHAWQWQCTKKRKQIICGSLSHSNEALLDETRRGGGCIVNTFHHIRTRMGDLGDLYNTAMKWGTPRWFLFSSIKQLNIVWLSENFNRQTVHKKINIVLYTFIGNSQQWHCMKCDEINIDIHNKHKHMTENDHQTQFGYDSYTTITRILFFVHLN